VVVIETLVATIVVALGVVSTPSIASAANDASTGDEITPLVITTVGADPIPVKGSDDKFHVAYELSVLNYHPYPAVVTSLETLAPDGHVVTSWSQEQLGPLTMVVPDLTMSGMPATGIPPGGTALLILEDVYPSRASIPRSVTHRISATFSPPAEVAPARVAIFPPSVTEIGGRVSTSTQDAVVLGAPVTGPGWVMGNGCCDRINAHRVVELPVGGTINGSERFGIDVTGIEPGLAPGTALSQDMLFEPGTDGTKNEDYRGYRAPLLAVADGTVVKAVTDIPDTAPDAAPGGEEGLALSDVGGNVVVLRIAPHLFAFYLHNAPGSTTVKVGDKVVKGQQIAELGSSGNSTSPHLHFQLGRSRQLLSAENVPYVFERFVVEGMTNGTEFVAEPTPGPRKDELPLRDNVVDFPAAR
jgi:Peptidase family M23